MEKQTTAKSFSISKYPFNNDTLQNIESNVWAKSLWPMVYIISNDNLKEAYVGESTSAISRMSNHLLNTEKQKLSLLHLIGSNDFNKSATLDIESNLIKYISSDKLYKLQNGNMGLSFHNYYQKEEYWDLFVKIWEELKKENIAVHDLQEIDNSDLFKYSPYKALTQDQYNVIIALIEVLNVNEKSTSFIEGTAGTGKTILAIFMIKLLVTDFDVLFNNIESVSKEEKEIIFTLKNKYKNKVPKVALVVPMASLRNTLKTVFKEINGLHPNMVISPSDVAKSNYDILLVDEAHRLRQRKSLSQYGQFDKNNTLLKLSKDSTELDWILKQSTHQIFFYDPAQSVRPSDISKDRFDSLLRKIIPFKLKSQLRVKGGTDYIKFVHQLMNASHSKENIFKSNTYELLLFDSLEALISKIKQREHEVGLSRLVAGYAWEWKTKKDKNVYDIEISNIQLRWNQEPNEWINSDNAINEVGCIHTTQGYDLNYTGVIFGNEVSYDEKTNQIIIVKDNYYDRNGKAGIEDPELLKAYIINIYKTLMYRGILGTYLYVCDDKLREYLKKYVQENGSKKDVLPLYDRKLNNQCIPFYDISAAAGGFSDIQEISELKWIELPSSYNVKKDCFVCKVVGESMNKKIPNGSLCIFQKDQGGSREGKIVLVQHRTIQDTDFGVGLTVKKYHSKKNMEEDNWKHNEIVLKPMSTNSNYKDIVLIEDEFRELALVGIFVEVIM